VHRRAVLLLVRHPTVLPLTTAHWVLISPNRVAGGRILLRIELDQVRGILPGGVTGVVRCRICVDSQHKDEREQGRQNRHGEGVRI